MTGWRKCWGPAQRFCKLRPADKADSLQRYRQEIFGSAYLDLEQKGCIFKLIAKVLTLLPDAWDNEAYAVYQRIRHKQHIQVYIRLHLSPRQHKLTPPGKDSLFPRHLRPLFAGAQRRLQKEIRRLGFEVFLAIDEFSWSKRTQPSITRRNIINMSVADQPGIFLYPGDIPINIANPKDLRALRHSFPCSEVYIVVGSDVILHASGYRDKKSPDSIHSFNHIIFDRKSASPRRMMTRDWEGK